MSYIKDRLGNSIYYKDHQNRYYSCKDGSYQGRREPDNSGYYTDKHGNIAGYRGTNGVYVDRNGNPKYHK